MSQTNCPSVTKLQIQIKPQVAPSHSQPEPTCSHSQSLAQKATCLPLAWHLYSPPRVGNLCFIQHDTLGWTYHQQETPVVRRQETYWDGPTTSRKPLWLALFVLLMGNKPMWQPYHNFLPAKLKFVPKFRHRYIHIIASDGSCMLPS